MSGVCFLPTPTPSLPFPFLPPSVFKYVNHWCRSPTETFRLASLHKCRGPLDAHELVVGSRATLVAGGRRVLSAMWQGPRRAARLAGPDRGVLNFLRVPYKTLKALQCLFPLPAQQKSRSTLRWPSLLHAYQALPHSSLFVCPRMRVEGHLGSKFTSLLSVKASA